MKDNQPTVASAIVGVFDEELRDLVFAAASTHSRANFTGFWISASVKTMAEFERAR